MRCPAPTVSATNPSTSPSSKAATAQRRCHRRCDSHADTGAARGARRRTAASARAAMKRSARPEGSAPSSATRVAQRRSSAVQSGWSVPAVSNAWISSTCRAVGSSIGTLYRADPRPPRSDRMGRSAPLHPATARPRRAADSDGLHSCVFMLVALLVRLLLCTPLAALLRSGVVPWAWPIGGEEALTLSVQAARLRARRPPTRHVMTGRAPQRRRPLRRPRGREPPGVDPPPATTTAATTFRRRLREGRRRWHVCTPRVGRHFRMLQGSREKPAPTSTISKPALTNWNQAPSPAPACRKGCLTAGKSGGLPR